MKEEPRTYYPVFLNIKSKKCVVVGGGNIALRKIKILLDHSAHIEVISPQICAELNRLAEKGDIIVQRRQFESGDLSGAFISVAATDNKHINNEVMKEAKETGVLINVVDDPINSDFFVPSIVRRGDMVIAVSTTGRSPALARKIRTMLAKDFGKEYAVLLSLIDEVRTEMKNQGITVDTEVWQEALDLDLITGILKKGDREKAKAVLLDNLKTS